MGRSESLQLTEPGPKSLSQKVAALFGRNREPAPAEHTSVADRDRMFERPVSDMNPEQLRREFHVRMYELAGEFDHLDHEIAPLYGSLMTDIQHDAEKLRQLAAELTDVHDKDMHARGVNLR